MWEIILQGHIMSTSGDALRCVEQILSLSCDWILANSKPYTPNGSNQLRRTEVACILLALLVNWVLLVRVLTSGLTVWMQMLCCISHSLRYTTIVLLMYQSWYGFVLVERSMSHWSENQVRWLYIFWEDVALHHFCLLASVVISSVLMAHIIVAVL
jgi:hypothetical protein